MTSDRPAELSLPELREDIQLLPGPTALDGSPTWTIFDPVRNSYFKIGWPAFQLLSHWSAGNVETILYHIKSETTCDLNDKDVEDLLRFLYSNNMTRDSANSSPNDYLEQYQARRPGWIKWLLQNYLFLRFPLVRPNRFLQWITPRVDPLFTSTTRNIILLLGVLGLYLVVRQWDSYVNTFLYFFNLQGAVFYIIALVFIKILHELGHAITATRFGCKIPTMGVAFLVLFPVLYTDTTDAYRLTSRKQRLYISAAGLLTEFYLALVCIFLWSFLPDGIPRSIAFIVATVSFSLTVLINMNPFMRFDGYYILSDWLAMENLQNRSFALGKWKLREWIFAFNDQPPEKFKAGMQNFLIVYAWSTWIYRFFLLLAIALVVYYFFFKLLGIILFVAEIYIFILMPIFREISVWWKRRQSIMGSRRSYVLAMVIFVLLLTLFIPWNSHITFPAILEPLDKTTIYAPAPGRIKEVTASIGQDVKAGDVIAILEAPEITNDIARTQSEIRAINLRLQRIVASTEDLFDVNILHQSLNKQQSTLSGLLELQQQLVIRSPITGRIVEMDESLHPGRWLNEDLPIAFIAREDESIIEGMAYEEDLARLAISQQARFIPDDATRDSISAVVEVLEQANVANLDVPYFASTYGGDIAVRQDRDNRLVPETSVYRVKLSLDENESLQPGQVIRGIAHVEGEAKSLARRGYEVVSAAMIRGSGF